MCARDKIPIAMKHRDLQLVEDESAAEGASTDKLYPPHIRHEVVLCAPLICMCCGESMPGIVFSYFHLPTIDAFYVIALARSSGGATSCASAAHAAAYHHESFADHASGTRK